MSAQGWWQRPLAPVLVIVLGVLLHLPALRLGFLADDWGQQLVLEQPIEGHSMQPWSLYDFGTKADMEAALGDSVLPWWTDPHWKARFFRPLSSLVLWGESALLGRNAPARHALGLLWQAGFLALAWHLFRALGLARGLALTALAVLACEDGAGMSVGWFANRNSLIEGVFTAGALLVALRARESGRGRELALALVLAGGAFGAKESGLAAWCGCAALWWRAPAAGARRARLVAVGLVLCAVLFLRLAGYGTVSAFYPTPWGDPGRYARHLVGLVTTAPLGLLGPYPLDALEMVPRAYGVLVGCALLTLLVLRAPLRRAAARVPHAGALLVFAAASLGTQACALPSDRLLFVPALVLVPFVAALLEELLRGSASARRRWRVLGRALVVTALPLSALALVLRGLLMADFSTRLAPVFAQAELEPGSGVRRDVLLLSGPSVMAMLSPQAGWRFATGERETHFHPLQMLQRGLVLTRTDERTLEIESTDEPFLSTPFEGVFLGPSGPPAAGERRRNSAFEFELVAPARVRVQTPETWEAVRPRLLAWDGQLWRRIEPPAVGRRLVLPRAPALSPFVP